MMNGVSIGVHYFQQYFRLYQEDYLNNCFGYPLGRKNMLHQKSLVKIENYKIKVAKSLNVCEMFCK